MKTSEVLAKVIKAVIPEEVIVNPLFQLPEKTGFTMESFRGDKFFAKISNSRKAKKGE